jgi:hypothetical protein
LWFVLSRGLTIVAPFAARLLNPVQTFVMWFNIRTDRGRFGREPGPAGRDCHGLHGL